MPSSCAGCILQVRCALCGSCGAACLFVIRSLPTGARPFAGVDSKSGLARLRLLIDLIGVAKAKEYRTHDLRRGHGQDLVESGATLAELLAAGEWRSNAFKAYLQEECLEAGAVMEAHYDDSCDDEAWGLDDWPLEASASGGLSS